MSDDQAAPTTGNWGRWGPDDERGSLNLLTPEHVRRAAAAVKTGKTYSLGVPIQAEGVPIYDYRGKPMRLTLMDGTDEGAFAGYGCSPGTGAHEDVVVFASHTTSHIDALIHVFEDFHHYNGVDYSAMKAMSGAVKLGIDKVGGFAARAVILDFPRLNGVDWLEPGTPVTADDLERCSRAQGTEIGTGDVVLIRTGYLQMWFANAGNVGMEQPGIDASGAEWLAARDVVAVGADNGAVEVVPFDGNDFLICHKILLVRSGIYLLEFMDLSTPAADGCYEGLLTVAPLKVTGATGSPINPIFIG